MRLLLVNTAAFFIAVLLQVMVAPYIAIGGVSPNFLMITVIIMALVEGPNTGTVLGFVAGLLFDLLGAGPVGPMALVLSITGYIAGLVQENLFAEGWILPVGVIALATFTSEILYMIVILFLGTQTSLASAFFGIVLPSTFYNAVCATIICPILTRALRDNTSSVIFGTLW
ncbi:MAG: rod shape-determining protein MreD [Coriobacteriia bacterium]|nr:rod shape-determining protein MreD [Coriobacteriia bacterium]